MDKVKQVSFDTLGNVAFLSLCGLLVVALVVRVIAVLVCATLGR